MLFDSPRGILMFRRNFCFRFVPEHGGKNFPQMLILLPECTASCCHVTCSVDISAGNIQFSSLQRPQRLCGLQPGRHTFTVGTRAQIQIRPCGICGEQISSGTGLSPEVIRFSPVSTIHQSSTLTHLSPNLCNNGSR